MFPKTPAPSTSRKHHAVDDVGDSVSVKRSSCNGKTSAGQAISSMASSVQGLAEALAKPDPLTTPEHRTAAISIIEKETAFSDCSHNKVFKLIHRDIAFAESITSIQDAQKHVGYIHSELEDL